MSVVATAGHVDHGKSRLVQALTGRDPDRLAEEHRRGLTLDLGFAWTDLPSGRCSVVDVPGHERYVATMLAGVAPVGAVLLVVAADEGWRAQTEEHVRALAALGVPTLSVALTKIDHPRVCADRLARLEVDVRRRLDDHGLRPQSVVPVSAVTGEGLADLREALDQLLRGAPAPDPSAPVRLWIDRAFTLRGAGTVVTGTLGAGTLAVGDRLRLHDRTVRVRALQSCDHDVEKMSGVARVAVNLAGVARHDVGRGDVLIGSGLRPPSASWVRARPAANLPLPRRIPRHLTLHVGTAAIPVIVGRRPDDTLGLTPRGGQRWATLPLLVGDLVLLRDPGDRDLLLGLTILAVPDSHTRGARRPIDPPTERGGGEGRRRNGEDRLGELLAGLGPHPLAALSVSACYARGLAPRDLAEAEAAGRVTRVGGLVLTGRAHDAARELLAARAPDGPFSAGDACRAMGVGRRVGIPLLERLDALRITQRHPDGTRSLRR